MPGVFFRCFAPATGLANSVRRTICQITGKFTTAPAYRVDIHARDLCQQFGTAMTDPVCFDRNIPTSLLFIQPAQQDIQL